MSDPFDDFKRPTKVKAYWTLPDAPGIVAALRVVGGNFVEMLTRLSDNELDHIQIAFLIEEELSKPENEPHRKAWEKYQLFFYKSQIALGTATLLKNYAKGQVDKHQFVKDVGKQILPGIFAPGIGASAKQEIEQQVDGHLAKYGEQPEEPASSIRPD